MRILGISCDFHDAAAALVVNGEVVAACEEERLSRLKHDSSLPVRAIMSVLATAGLEPGDVDRVVFHEKPLVAAGRVVAARQRVGPRALRSTVRDLPVVFGRNLFLSARVDDLFRRLGRSKPPPVGFSEHHTSHAAAAFLPSPFRTAGILTIDGLGEWATASYGRGHDHHVDLLAEQRFPHSLGLVYSLATVWCGFEANDGEYKLMGLAPFGEPRYADALRELIIPLDDGSISVNSRRVHWWSGDPRGSRDLTTLLGGPARRPDEPLTSHHADLARSVQELTEEVVLKAAGHVHDETGERDLCLAGGVALNCVANGRLLREGPFRSIWVQPAAGDAGSALGAALWWWHVVEGKRRTRADDLPLTSDAMSGAALGPRFSSDEVTAWASHLGLETTCIPDVDERCEAVARRLADGAIVGWFDGAMELGPRALGRRSILADPRSPHVHADLNTRVKGRESFRPFAPAVLWEAAPDWFDIDQPSPYMTLTHQVADRHLLDVAEEPTDFIERARVARSTIPACTHIDGSARVQTVHAEHHPTFHRLLRAFGDRTGCPVLLNTSFNRAGEPIVATPSDALATARAAGLDLLVIEDHLIETGPTRG